MNKNVGMLSIILANHIVEMHAQVFLKASILFINTLVKYASHEEKS